MRRIALSTVLAALSLAACGERAVLTDAVFADETTAGTLLPITRLSHQTASLTYSSGLADSARAVITDEAEWAKTWTAIWSNHSPEPARPRIDFEHERLVVAALGRRGSGGYGILVEAAIQHTDYVEVVIRTLAPGSGCPVPAGITEPVDAARIPAGTLPVRFSERSLVLACS